MLKVSERLPVVGSGRGLAAMSVLLLVLCSFPCSAQFDAMDKDRVFYGGIGTKVNDRVPLSMGMLTYEEKTPHSPAYFWGFDLAAEGELLDHTHDKTKWRSGISLNLIAGRTLIGKQGSGLAGAFLIGARAVERKYPSGHSHAGCKCHEEFHCYADHDPVYEHKFNVGGILSYTHKKSGIMFGLRVTRESKQLIVGFRPYK